MCHCENAAGQTISGRFQDFHALGNFLACRRGMAGNQEHLIGTPASHGCIRLRNRDIDVLFEAVDDLPAWCWVVPDVAA